MALGILALLGPLVARSQAQFSISVGVGANPYVNPMAGGGFGFSGFGFGGWGGGFGGLGYGSLLPGGGMGAYGGMGGGLESGLLSGAGFGYGYGYGFGLANTQWMMNPYQGYLQGAGDITRANAQYYQTLQQAKLTRQEAIRSSLETRRAMIEEAEWERAHMPDPEKIRQRTLQRELTTARAAPPPTDIWSGRALNALLRHLITQIGDGAKGPRVPLSEDLAKHVNVKVGDSSGNVSLLKNKGELDWPEALQGSVFKEGREQINALIQRAYRSVDSGNAPDPATLNDLQAQFRKLRETLRNNVSDLKPDEFIEAQRYVNEVGQTVKGLQDPNVVHQFSDDWKPKKARFVHELVQHMRDKGLLFAPASDDDQAAYIALYHALAAFDAGMTRVARGTSDAGENR
ncbi:MAG TPA: hypothetical protein VH592_19975 [Gemmataceae bacterium]|jgi:hypothetical protein